MNKETSIKLFEQKQICSTWDEEQGKWYFSIIDVVEVLTESPSPRKYWNALKTKLIEEGSESSQKLGQLKMQSIDGKFCKTDVADTEQLFRIIQSIPSFRSYTQTGILTTEPSTKNFTSNVIFPFNKVPKTCLRVVAVMPSCDFVL